MHGTFDGLGRFAHPSLLILTSLSNGPRHGYAIMTDVAAFSTVTMEPGTLYGALARLERRGWVRPLPAEDRRRPSPPSPATASAPGAVAVAPGGRAVAGAPTAGDTLALWTLP